MENLSRPIQIKFRVNALERDKIRDRMKECNIRNLGRYLRNMAINGCIIKPDYTEIKRMNCELHKIGVNINQIAKKANTNNAVSYADMKEVSSIMRKIRSEMNAWREQWL